MLHGAGTVVHTLQSTDLHIDSEGPQGVQVNEVRGGGGGLSLLHGGLCLDVTLVWTSSTLSTGSRVSTVHLVSVRNKMCQLSVTRELPRTILSAIAVLHILNTCIFTILLLTSFILT